MKRKIGIYISVIIIVLISHSIYASSEGERNFAIASRYFTEVLNEGKIELIDQLFAEDFEFINYDNSAHWSGIERLKKVAKMLVENGRRYEIVDHVADDNGNLYIMVRSVLPWPKYAPPSDAKETISVLVHERMWVRDGKIIKFTRGSDQFNQLRELSGFEGSFIDMVKSLSSE